MRAKVIYTVGALLAGVLLIWSCDTETNTGGLDSPCSSDSECGSGLVCAVARCSDRSAGRPCMIDKQCGGGLICNGAVCGGAAGEFCRADANCAEGLICTRNSTCAMSSGGVGDPCGSHGHCTGVDLVCQEDGTCGVAVRGGLGDACDADSACDNNSDLVCINDICNEKSNLNGACNDTNHCTDGLVCGNDNMCGRVAGTACTMDGECEGSSICAGVPGNQVCASSDRMNGSPCRIDDHCDGALVCGDTGTCGIAASNTCVIGDDLCAGSLLCTGVIGNQVCASSDGILGSVCGIDNHCNTDAGLVCSSGTCLVGSGNTCSDDDQCASSLLCTGVPGSQTCTSSDGMNGDPCSVGNDDHCDSALVCGDTGTCGIAAGNTCAMDDAECAGSLLCTGVPGSQTCTSSDGMNGDPCSVGNDDHCDGALVCGDAGTCGIAAGDTCAMDDAECAGSLLCTGAMGSRTCASSNGMTGSSCRIGNDDHCDGALVCGDTGTCGTAAGDMCVMSDTQCAGSLLCTGVIGNQVCASSDGIRGSVCGIDDHCSTNDGLVCSSGTCLVGSGNTCTAVGHCAGSLRCNEVMGSLQCSTAGNGALDSVCGFDAHCTDAICSSGTCKIEQGGTCTTSSQCASGLLCTMMTGGLECTPVTGEIGSVCSDDTDCTTTDATCSSGMCKVTSGGACTDDDQCVSGSVCAGTAGSLTCTVSDGSIGSTCRIGTHCTSPLVCSNDVCRAISGGTCTADSQCAFSLLCTGAAGSQTCASAGDGELMSVCGIDDHCTGNDLVCSSGMCKVESGGTCTADNQCSDALVCTGTSGSQTCNTAGTGAIGQICGINTHCTSPLVCGGGICGTAAGGSCTADMQCVGALVCTGAASMQTCNTAGTGAIGEICGSDTHCTDPLFCHEGTCIETGTVWTSQTNPAGSNRILYNVRYANNLWVAAGTAGIITSTNGIMWESQTINNAEGTFWDIHYANGRWVAVGELTTRHPLPPDASVLVTSTNGTTWEVQQISTNAGVGVGLLSDIYYASGRWIAVGSGSIIVTSTNGTTWEAINAVDGLSYVRHDGNSRWVAVGGVYDSMTSTTTPAIATSTNGTTWAPQTSNASGFLADVHYANSLWVATGNDGVITTSTNGTTWTARTSNVGGHLSDVHYDNSLWVAVGFDGAVTTSTNGTSWTASIDDKGTADTSDDTNWVNNWLSKSHYGNNIWIAVGRGGDIITSTNGTTWTAQTSNVNGQLNDIHYANNLWVGVGDNGIIITAP